MYCTESKGHNWYINHFQTDNSLISSIFEVCGVYTHVGLRVFTHVHWKRLFIGWYIISRQIQIFFSKMWHIFHHLLIVNSGQSNFGGKNRKYPVNSCLFSLTRAIKEPMINLFLMHKNISCNLSLSVVISAKNLLFALSYLIDAFHSMFQVIRSMLFQQVQEVQWVP